MDWITGMQKAIDYIEEHITEKLDYEEIAKQSFSSGYHFQRVFSILCGYTLGQYIRNRRLSLAGNELAADKAKVIDVALKYGYESPDSFTKAFQRFHGITPSEAREPGAVLRPFARLYVKISLEGAADSSMNCRIEEKPEMILTGYKQRFSGVPYGEQREKQEGNMYMTTRAKQWLLRGASYDYETDYCIVDNVDDDGYDFYIANRLSEAARADLYNQAVTGVDFMEKMNFEDIIIPKQAYVIFETERSKNPIGAYIDIRNRIVTEWLANSEYQLADSPELVLLHWRPAEGRKRRFVEVWIPIEKK